MLTVIYCSPRFRPTVRTLFFDMEFAYPTPLTQQIIGVVTFMFGLFLLLFNGSVGVLILKVLRFPFL